MLFWNSLNLKNKKRTNREWQSAMQSLVESVLDLVAAATPTIYVNHMNQTILAVFTFLATASCAQSATVMFSARGHVTAALGTVYSPAGLGSEVEVMVTYDELATDLDESPRLARYQPSNFSLALRLIGGSTIFQTSAGSITVDTIPGTSPALHILARLPDGNDLFFLFHDDDRSFVSLDTLPTSYGSITDWDQIGLSVLLNPAMWPDPSSNPLDVTFSAISIPEPSSTALAAFGSILGLCRRRRWDTRS
jgi:PEP-CTERM motif